MNPAGNQAGASQGDGLGVSSYDEIHTKASENAEEAVQTVLFVFPLFYLALAFRKKIPSEMSTMAPGLFIPTITPGSGA